MPERIICRTCGTEVELPASYAVTAPRAVSIAFGGPRPSTAALEERRERSLAASVRRILLTLGYILAAAGVAAFFLLGLGFNHKASIFLWSQDQIGSIVGLIKDRCFAVTFFPLAFVVALAFSAVRLRALLIAVIVAAFALGAYCGILHFTNRADWAKLDWFYNSLTGAALLAILVGLLISKRWIVLGFFVAGTVALALVGRYLNRDTNLTISVDWLPLYAGVFHGLIFGLTARLASWLMNRNVASTLLGALVGGFLGLLVVDLENSAIRDMLRTPGLPAINLLLASLYVEAALSFILALATGLLGRHPYTAEPIEGLTPRRRSSLAY